MKLIKILIVFMVLMAAAAAQAQLGVPQLAVKSGTTSGAYAAITNNTSAYPTNAIIEVGKYQKCGIQLVAELSGAGTTANTVTIQQSLDRTNWVTHTAFTITPAGTTAGSVITNLDVSGIPYLRVYSIANANANTGYMTNYTIRAYPK